MCCIIYGLRHDAIVIDCSALRFGTRWSEVFTITTMESRKVNGKIFISGRSNSHVRTDPRLGTDFTRTVTLRVFVTRFTDSAAPLSKILPEAASRARFKRVSLNFDGSITVHSYIVCSYNVEALIQTFEPVNRTNFLLRSLK